MNRNTHAHAHAEVHARDGAPLALVRYTRDVLAVPEPIVPARYTDALHDLVRTHPEVSGKHALRRMRHTFCACAQPHDWPGDRTIVLKLAFVRAAIAYRNHP